MPNWNDIKTHLKPSNQNFQKRLIKFGTAGNKQN